MTFFVLFLFSIFALLSVSCESTNNPLAKQKTPHWRDASGSSKLPWNRPNSATDNGALGRAFNQNQ